MSIVETGRQNAGQSSIDQPNDRFLQVSAAVAFFSIVGVAMLGWIGFLVWIVLALAGF